MADFALPVLCGKLFWVVMRLAMIRIPAMFDKALWLLSRTRKPPDTRNMVDE